MLNLSPEMQFCNWIYISQFSQNVHPKTILGCTQTLTDPCLGLVNITLNRKLCPIAECLSNILPLIGKRGP